MTSLAAQPLQQFCDRHGISRPFEMHRLRTGRNSEVFHLRNDDGQWILKHYYQHALDKRDRLGTEFGFLKFLTNCGVPGIAQPLGADFGLNCGLYSFLPGNRPEIITTQHVRQAAAFIRDVNRAPRTASPLPKAADACLSWQDHLLLAQSRILQLLAVPPLEEPQLEAHAFVSGQLLPYWNGLKANILQAVDPAELARPLAPELQIISPSDFGFHNALEHDGRLSFVDFEYAGWDDPAKLICDFACQPELPVCSAQSLLFQNELLPMWPQANQVKQRVTLLLPVHRLKWCCILLNEFKLQDRQRRAHAGVEQEDLLVRQLHKAKHYFTTHLAPAI